MAGYDVRATSPAAPSHICALLLDASTWSDWSPIDAASVEDDTAVRVIRTGRSVSRERVVEALQDQRMAYVIESGSRLLIDYRGQVDLEPADAGGTTIRWRATWRSPAPVLGRLVQAYLRRFQQRTVDGLARHAGSASDREE